MSTISDIYIYSDPRCEAIDYGDVAAYVRRLTARVPVGLRGPLLEESIDGTGPLGRAVAAQEIAMTLASARVRCLEEPLAGHAESLAGEIDYEARRLSNRSSSVYGIMYDAYALADLFKRLLPADESSLCRMHIIFTGQLIGTWEDSGRRYHARSVLLGDPSIVSVSGMVAAPARSRGYYLARRSAAAFGLSEEAQREIASSFLDDCLSYDDPRLTHVSKGLAAQAIAYRISGEPFCEDPGCRMFNAHWQRALMESQLSGDKEFCQKHEQLIRRFADRGEAVWI